MCALSQPINQIAIIAHPRDGSAKVFAMIDAYLGESGIHENAKVCVICGYFGGLPGMKQLGRKWQAVLKKHSFNMRDFHAKDLLKRRTARPMLSDLAAAIEQSRSAYPVSSGIVVRDFFSFSRRQRRFMTGATIQRKTKKLITSGCPTKPYFVPFQNVVKIVTDNTPVAERAHFSFGTDREFAEYARSLFRQMEIAKEASYREAYSTWRTRNRLGSSHFPSASETAQLQAADLLVHLTYLYMLRIKMGEDVAEHTDLLRSCLANAKSPQHHVYQDRMSLQKTLDKIPSDLLGWEESA